MLNTHIECVVEEEEINYTNNDQTPLRNDAFEKSDTEKMILIEEHFKSIMEILGLDLEDDSLKDTPKRVSKMFVKEVFSGLNPANFPEIKVFDNKFHYNQMLVEKDISFFTYCEHHFVPFYGKVHIAYISTGKIVGLSKLNRIVHFFAKRPQVQERLTMQIGNCLKNILKTNDVAVYIEAEHLCIRSRGVQDINSKTVTNYFTGVFESDLKKSEFFQYLKNN